MALVALAVVAPGLVRASCAEEPGNLLAKHNCDFATSVAGWTTDPPAAVRHDAKQGDTAAGALLADGGPQGSVTVVGPCVKTKPSTRYAYAAHFRTSKGNAYFCTVQLFAIAGSCAGERAPLAAQGAPPSTDWIIVSADALTGEDAGFLEMRLVCSGEPGHEVAWDDVYLMEP
jgi:hypothetical protein